MSYIFKPFGWVLSFFSNLAGGNFAAAVLIFTILVNVLMIPLTLKTQKGMVKQTRLKPKLDALKEKYGADKQKYSIEMQALHQRENVSMTGGGCLPMVIRMILLMAVYMTVISPLTNILGIDADLIAQAREATGARNELELVSLIYAGKVAGISPPDIAGLDFNFFGLNLSQTPHFSFNVFSAWQSIWLIPVLSFVTSMITSVFTTQIQKKVNPDAPNMSCMMYAMPLFSLVIAFSVPGAVGFYWACSNLVAGGIQIIIQYIYNPSRLVAADRAKTIKTRWALERRKIENRQAAGSAQTK